MKTKNTFYSDFDFEPVEEGSPLDYRTVFQRDRDRIIHSSSFRRLQAKTQVFLSGEYDFYRTRLTHSIEVAQIGRSICNFLREESPLLSNDFFIDSDLVEAACLTHDLGHPPFGHAGERTLNQIMKEYGGFEGNAQTLRTLTETFYSDGGKRKGMNPSRAFLDGIMKYKTLFGELKSPENHFLYDNQSKYLHYIFGGLSVPDSYPPGKKRDTLRSIECQIMDWADDTAYSLNDIIDGSNAGFITARKLAGWGADRQIDKSQSALLDNLLQQMHTENIERVFARKVGDFIRAVRLEKRVNFMSGLTSRHCFSLVIDPVVQKEAEFYKKIAVDLVFRSPQLHQLEYKWDFILKQLFGALEKNYLTPKGSGFRILSEETDRTLRQEGDPQIKARLICDQLAGMTDVFAIRTYKRLYDPDFGSIVDLI